MDEDKTTLINVLLKELELTREKSLTVDGWIFKFVSIGIIPFLILVGYSILEEKYKFIIIALPIVSLIGLLVVLIISYHYKYTSFYSNYLEHRINKLLGDNYLQNTNFVNIFYEGKFTVVTFSFIFGVLMLIAFNIIAYPYINSFLEILMKDQKVLTDYTKTLVRYFWHGIGTVGIIIIIGFVVPSRISLRKARRLLLNLTKK